MKKTLLFLVLFSASIISCNNDEIVEVQNAKLKVKSVLTADGLTEYTYGSNGFVSKMSFSSEHLDMYSEVIYKYEQNKLVQIQIYTNNLLFSTQEYFYKNDALVRSTYEEEGQEGSSSIEYLYNNVGELQESLGFSGSEKVATTKYEYFNGNLQSEHTKTIYGTEYGASYKYDDKVNFLTYTFPKEYLVISKQGKNNVITDGESFAYYYKYNSDNYPIEQQTGSFTNIITYF